MTAAERIASLKPRQRTVYDMLVTAAEQGRGCPTNAEFRYVVGSGRTSLSSQTIDELEDFGLIAVERIGQSRIVTIVATGAVTRRPSHLPPPRDDFQQTIGRPPIAPGEKRKPSGEFGDATPVRAAPAAPAPPPAPEPEPVMSEAPPVAAAPAAPPAPIAPGDFMVGIVAHNDALMLSVYLPVSDTPFLTIPVSDAKLLDLVADAAVALRSRKAA